MCEGTERHPMAETMDLIWKHIPLARTTSLQKIANVLDDVPLKPWHFELQPGDHVVITCEDDQFPLSIDVFEIAETTEEFLNSCRSINGPLAGFERLIIRAVKSCGLGDRASLECFSLHEFKMRLTDAQVKALRDSEWPTDLEGFVSALADTAALSARS